TWLASSSTTRPEARAFTPMRSRSFTMVRTSFRSGTLPIFTGPAVRSEAARIGSAAFFAPATRTSPDNGAPPRMDSFCIVPSVSGPLARALGSVRGPLRRGKCAHGQRVDLLAHPVAERRVHQLVAAHAREPLEGRAHDHRLEVRAVAAHLEVGALEARADGCFDGARFDHGARLVPSGAACSRGVAAAR